MAAKDVTPQFRKAVHDSAVRSGYDEARLAKVTSSLVMPPGHSRSPFMLMALEILEIMRSMQVFIVRHRQEYMDGHRSTERERDSIEHEVQEFVKTCRQKIEVLKSNIASANPHGPHLKNWVGQVPGKNVHMVAHQHGVVLILSEKLHTLTSAFDRMRAARFKEVLERTQHKRRPGLRSSQRAESSAMGQSHKQWNTPRNGQSFLPEGSNVPDGAGHQGGERLQQMVFDDETQTLQAELTGLLDSAQDTERKVLEMSALSHMLSTHVLEQSQQIELLYNQAVEATSNLGKGNKELAKAISYNSDSRALVILCFVVLIFAVLFLDWYDSR